MRWALVFHVPLCTFCVHVPPADYSDIFGIPADDVSAEITDEARLSFWPFAALVHDDSPSHASRIKNRVTHRDSLLTDPVSQTCKKVSGLSAAALNKPDTFDTFGPKRPVVLHMELVICKT
jgi:hypothetical protein